MLSSYAGALWITGDGYPFFCPGFRTVSHSG
nr:MAG TPA_asm: hypothetical protein [Caudoviricetes sp.]